MVYKLRLHLFFCLFYLSWFQTTFQAVAQKSKEIQVDTAISSYDYYGHKQKNEIYKILKINNLQDANIAIDIRIFRWEAFSNSRLLRIYKEKDNWIAQVYEYDVELEDVKPFSHDSLYQPPKVAALSNLEEKRLTTIKDIGKVWKKLVNLGIYTLPSMDSLQRKCDCILALANDGIVFSVHVKYNNYWRYYEYLNPQIIAKVKRNISELQRFNKMISILEKTFGINLQEFEALKRLKKKN